MKRETYYRFVILMTLLLSFLAPGGCEEEDPIGLRLKPQSRYQHKVQLVSRLHMLFPDIEVHKTEMLLDFYVKDVDKQGLATVEVTVASLKNAMKSMGFTTKYDSENPDEGTSQSADSEKKIKQKQKFRKVFDGFKGKKYHAQVDGEGKVLNIFDMDARIESVSQGPVKESSFGGYQIALLFSQTNLREYVAPALSHGLTAEAEEPNQPLTCFMPIEVPWALPVMGKKTYTFKSRENSDGQKAALLSLKIDEVKDKKLPSYSQKRSEKSKMYIIKAYGSGEVAFSLKHRRPVRYYEQVIAELSTSAGGNKRLSNKSKKAPSSYVVEKTIEYVE